MTTQIYKFAGDPPGASAPPAVGAPTLGGPSPGAPKAPAVPTLGHVPGPRMGGGMPSITRNVTMKLAGAAIGTGSDFLARHMAGAMKKEAPPPNPQPV